MSREKRLENEIDIIKRIFTLPIMAFFGICAYTFINFDNISFLGFCVIFVAIIALTAIQIMLTKQFIKINKEIEKL